MARTKQTKREALPGKPPVLPPVGSKLPPPATENASALGQGAAAAMSLNEVQAPKQKTLSPQAEFPTPKKGPEVTTRDSKPSVPNMTFEPKPGFSSTNAAFEPKPGTSATNFAFEPKAVPQTPAKGKGGYVQSKAGNKVDRKKVPANFEKLMLDSKKKVSKLATDFQDLSTKEEETQDQEEETQDQEEETQDQEEEEEQEQEMEGEEDEPVVYRGKNARPIREQLAWPSYTAVTVTVGLEGRHTFPVGSIEDSLKMDPFNDNILDFTGCAQVTDSVLLRMLELPSRVRGSVIGVRLTGCHLVTDVGVEFLAECFHTVKKLTLAGCPKVTEASLVVLAKKCKHLETLDIVGTNVSVLPRDLCDLILVTDCCPLVSPLPAEMKALPPASTHMTKVVVIRREGESTLSPLRLLQGEKAVESSMPFGFISDMTCGKDLLLNITECSQSTQDLFCHGWGVYVITSELNDKNRMEEEAKAVLTVIMSVLLKTGGGSFVLLGLHTNKAGIVPMATVVEKVRELMGKLSSSLDTKRHTLSSTESLVTQLELDHVERLRHRIKELRLTSLEVNMDEGKKASDMLKNFLAEEGKQSPELLEPCSTLSNILRHFPEKVGKDLQRGLHTLTGAAKSLQQGSGIKSPFEAQGAVLYLTKMGKLCSLKHADGREMYISTAFLCQILNTLCQEPPKSQNKTKDIAISDEAFVMTLDELTERAAKVKATVEFMWQVIGEVQVLGTQGLTGDIFIPFSCLPPHPDFSMDRFMPSPALAQVTYRYSLPFLVPAQTWWRAVSCLTAFHWPLHLWQHGLVVHRGTVEVLVTCEGEKITLLGQTISVSGTQGEEAMCHSTMWQCIEEYKLLLDAEMVTAGLLPEVACVSDKPRPDGVTAIMTGHSHFQDSANSNPRCQFCGDTAEMIDMILSAESTVNPRMLSTPNVYFCLFDELDSGGKLKGSNVTLETGGKANIYTRTAPSGTQRYTILFNTGNFQEIRLSLETASEKHKINFGNDHHISLKPMDSKEDTGELSKAVPGVALNVTIVSLVNQHVECTVDCRGEVLARETLPYNQYKLCIQAKERYLQAPQQMPQLAKDKVQFTVLCSDFGIFGTSQLKKGMKLEALDRKNPHLICVATIEDIKPEKRGNGGPLLIHFDGWSALYDYWAEETSDDLHPIGFMEQVGCKDQTLRTVLNAPKGYSKAFDWTTYLQEEKAEPVPYSFFTASQLKGTTPDTTLMACKALGLPAATDGEQHAFCITMPHRHAALEHWSRQELRKSFQEQQEPVKVKTFLKVNPRIFCLLPSNLDLAFLRYPSMATLCQLDRQSLHLLCHGQENLYHLVDHKGLKCSDVFSSYEGQELYLQCAYLLLSLSTAMTVPTDMKQLCQVEVLPVDQSRLERGFRRLYQLYLMLFRFLSLLKPKEQNTAALDSETQMKLVEAMKKEVDISTHFSHTPDFTKLECKAHKAAISNNKGLEAFPTEVLELGPTGTLCELYLSGNHLTSLPTDLSHRLSTLNQLKLSYNLLTSLPSLAGFKNLKQLHLAGNQLTTLELTDNLAATVLELTINDNPLQDLPSSLSKMSQLNVLIADNIGVIRSLDVICGLKNLKSASFSYCVVTSLPGKFHTCQLGKLQLAAIPLVRPRSASGMETMTTESLMKSYDKYNAFQQLPQKERTELFQMMPDKPEEVNITAINARLVQQFPRLGGVNFPPQLLQMTSLIQLDLSHQGFTTVPDDIKHLHQLTVLILNGCYNLESLSAQLSTLPLEALSLNDCPMLKTPPPEIVNRGFQAVFGYLRRLQMGSVVCKRTKLMMVGLGGAGKTSLVRCLRSGQFYEGTNYEEMITDGIDICEWNVAVEGESQPLQFSVWDFAGQTVYYNTHQFFMSNRAVYLLLWNIRLGYEHAGLDFWLSSIACHAPKAPVLIVGTHFDKVKKTHIPEVDLKRRFPQIHGFHFISSYTGHGVQKLKDDLKAVTLTQKYMGEKIPEVWLNLEKQLASVRAEGKALLPWREVESAGHSSGIFDNLELNQAVQFLHDLGSVQFFNTEFLRSYVVIVPQWIVDVMACVVTVHEGPIKNGVLEHADLVKVWHAYPKELHPWLLRLTEEFDLTFCLPDRPTNIIPCLLPDTEPEFEWPKANRDSGEREMKMVYKFDYLPAGLFNRAQVRLHEFSDNAVLWKKGSMLRKNCHSALVLQTGTVEVLVKALGFKPENVLFLVHEVFECLIAESYSGVHYDYLIPCVECTAMLQSEPCMFPRSKVQRAVEFKAPFLQCDSFHIMSIAEIQAIMPPDHSSDFDDHLHRSVHELHSLGQEVVISVFVCYSRKNVPTLAEDGKVIHPATILEDLRKAGYKVSFTDDPENANMQALTLSMKAAQVVIIGISDEFLTNKQCYSLICYTRETLKKPFLLMTLGKTAEWQKQDINFLLGNEVYVKMQDISRYNSKIKELVAAIRTKAGVKTVQTYPDCFISYCWKNSQQAVKLGTNSQPSALGWGDPRGIKDFLTENGVTCWLDIEQMGQEGFYEDLARGVRTSKVMVACVSDEYALSKTCRMEFQFAVTNVRIPVIVVVVGTGHQWESSEIGMLAVGHVCPKVNLQLENKAGLEEVVRRVKEVISKTTPSITTLATVASTPTSDSSASAASIAVRLSSLDQQKISFQEALELTERKLLRQLVMYRSHSGHTEFPHLVLVDLQLDPSNQGQGQEVIEQKSCAEEGTGEKVGEAECRKKMEEGVMDEEKGPEKGAQMNGTDSRLCFRVLCEWEQGWHAAPVTIPCPETSGDDEGFLKEVAAFLVRLMAVLRHTALPLPILTLPQGEQLCKNFEEWSSRNSTEFEDAYKRLLDVAQKQDKTMTYGGLKRCHVTNGKQLWLCPEHSTKVGGMNTDHDVVAVAYNKSPDTEEIVRHADNDDSGEGVLDEDGSNKTSGGGDAITSYYAAPPSLPDAAPRARSDRHKPPGKLNRAHSRACRLM